MSLPLVAIDRASGSVNEIYVSPQTAVLFGVLAGVICYYAVLLKNKLGWDDALDVWGVHGVGGLVGVVLLGLFADKVWDPAIPANGLFISGSPDFFFKQLIAVLLSSIWAFAFTYGMLKVINGITPVKVDEATEKTGLDEGLLGEEAYQRDVFM